MRVIIFAGLLIGSLVACTRIDTDPGGGSPGCWKCDGAHACKAVAAGSANCSVVADPSGISCTTHGKCGVGNPFTDVVAFETGLPEDRESVALEQRINRYFHNDVLPKVRKCWQTVQGKGTVIIEHRYKRQGSGKWVPKQLEVFRSSLPENQRRTALMCMREAVQGTSFPPDEWDGTEKEFVLFWVWTVPFPNEIK